MSNHHTTLVILLSFGLVSGCVGCVRGLDPPQPETVQPAEATLPRDEHAAVLAAAIAEGWFRFGLQSRSAGGHTFYVVEPSAPDDVLEAVQRSMALPPAEIVWVEALDEVPHDPTDGMFTDGYAVSVGEVMSLEPETLLVDVGYHYGVGDSNVSTVRFTRTDGEWSVVSPGDGS